MKVLVTALLSVGLHLALGWEWTLAAGVVGGLWASRGGWIVGASGVAVGWAVLVVYTAWIAPAPLRILVDTIGAMAGNIPGAALVGLTVLIGSLLGGLGGSIGAVLRPTAVSFLPAAE